MEFNFMINDFEGPLDLLLHLIKESKMDIMNIEIEEITKQYMAFLDQTEKMNLEISSEYLVLASELIEIKSRMLLPRNQMEEDSEEEDPREDLIQRLLEYQAYKDITPSLQEMEAERSMAYSKNPSLNITGVDLNPELSDIVDMDALTNAFKEFIKRKEAEKPLATKITNKEYSVHERSREIKSVLNKKGKVKFEELFTEYNRNYIVVTFLSILIMAKNGEVLIEQEENFKELYISNRK